MVTKIAGVIDETFVTLVSFYFFVIKLTLVQTTALPLAQKP
jgi:hypothetical protein